MRLRALLLCCFIIFLFAGSLGTRLTFDWFSFNHDVIVYDQLSIPSYGGVIIKKTSCARDIN